MIESVFFLVLISGLLGAAVLFSMDATAPSGTITVTTTTETIAATGNKLPIEYQNGKVRIHAWVVLTPGTNTTAVTLAIYAGTAITGRNVGSKQAVAGTFTVGSIATFTADFLDVITAPGEVQYCVSVLQTGASGNGTIQAALIETAVLSG